MEKKGERERVVNGKKITLVLKPAGMLRTWPFFEDRGPNPYLLLTHQAEIPDRKPLAEWLIQDEANVLLEPLVKFLYPVIKLLGPGPAV